MSDASPQDLAISFRSIARRRREAQPDTPSEHADEIGRRIDAQVATAAGLLHAGPDATQVADAIGAVHAKDWNDETLASLRSIATEIGTMLRDLAALSPEPGA